MQIQFLCCRTIDVPLFLLLFCLAYKLFVLFFFYEIFILSYCIAQVLYIMFPPIFPIAKTL